MLIAGATMLAASALPAGAQECEPAGGAVEVHARIAGSDSLTVSYTVVNNTRASLRWVQIGAGGLERTPLVPQQTPVIQTAPSGWRGTVVYPEETSYMHLWWEAEQVAAALPPGGSTGGFVVGVAGPGAVRPGLRGMDGRVVRPIDFGALPFTVGGSEGRCWWGKVRLAQAQPAPAAPPAMQARVRVVVPQLGPGWRTGMLNATRQAPPCYLVLLFHPGRSRQVAATVYLGAVSRIQVSSLYPGTGASDPDPGAGGYDGEQWREVPLDSMKTSGQNCPTGIEPAR
jgi:hypothetical protein